VALLPMTQLTPALRLSNMGIGTAPLGGLYGAADPAQGVAILHAALESGLRYFDSAMLYGGGQALEILGAALGPDPSRQYPDLVISFKVGRLFVSGAHDPHASGKSLHATGSYPACTRRYVFDYSADGIRRSFDQSMDALNRGRAEGGLSALSPGELPIIAYVHDPGVAEHGPEQPAVMRQVLGEAFPELRSMQRQGLLRAYGIGTNEISPCVAALADPHITLLMLAGHGTLLCNGAPAAPSSMRERSDEFDALLAGLAAHPNHPKLAIAAIGNSGLAYGGPMFNYAPASPEVLAFRDRLFTAVREFSAQPISIIRLLVHYPFAAFGKAVATVVPGPGKMADLPPLLDAFRAGPPPQELWDHLSAQGLIRKTLPPS